MRTIYNLCFKVFFLFAAPYYFLKMRRRGEWRPGFGQRFGRYSAKFKQTLTNRQVLWIHAVSVGEVNLATQLIRALEPRLPNLKIVVSTTTSTGMGELRKKLPVHIEKIYYPIDERRIVQRVLSVIQPIAVVLVEAEIWPNLIWQLKSRRIPLFLVNARLSQRSFGGYRFFRGLFRPLFASFAGVGAQTEGDAMRLSQLGCPSEAVQVMGSLKYDAVPLESRHFLDVRALLEQLGVAPKAPLLVGGSTHAGEEAILADQFRSLKARFPDLFLVLAPRHFERGKEVGRVLEERQIRFVYRSEITRQTCFDTGRIECLLLNTTGELRFFYQYATVIFVGKSLSAQGGQSPIEPGALGKAMVFGPNMQNFRAIADAFVHRGGAVQVPNAEALEQTLRELLEDEPRRQALGRQALAVVRENQGAIERTVEMIVRKLEERGD